MVTETELAAIMPHLKATDRAKYLLHLQAAMAEFEITTYEREAAFLAQLAHESGELRWMEEIASGAAYEGRLDLGNTQKGDGKRFKGRGPIQLTGRANYKKAGADLGVDLVNQPTRAADPDVAFRIAGWYWKSRKINSDADQVKTVADLGAQAAPSAAFKTITKKINGGTNGIADRWMFHRRALMTLSKGDDAAPAEAPSLRVVIDGRDVTAEGKPLNRAGTILISLKPVTKLLGIGILDTTGGRALLRLPNGDNLRVPLLIEGGVGWVALADLPGTRTWDPTTKTATLDTVIPDA